MYADRGCEGVDGGKVMEGPGVAQGRWIISYDVSLMCLSGAGRMGGLGVWETYM